MSTVKKTTASTHTPKAKVPRVRRMSVRHLRETFSGITPCPLTLAHVHIGKSARARQMLQGVLPILAEHADGVLEPRGYARNIAALLQFLDADEEVHVLVHPIESAPADCLVPLVLEIAKKADADEQEDLALQLFEFWRLLGVTNVTLDTIASELLLSATTYMRKIGWKYYFMDATRTLEALNERLE